MNRLHLPLWLKLSLTAFLVEAAMLAILVSNTMLLAEEELILGLRQRIEAERPLLNAALAGPMMQRDYGALRGILDETRSGGHSYAYLVVLDPDGRRIVASGLGPEQALPPLDNELSAHRAIFDSAMPITLGGTNYAQLRFGIHTDVLAQARSRLLRTGTLLGLAGMLLTFPILALIGYWLTRRLDQLTEASHALAAQDFDARLPPAGPDEVGQLAAAFHEMTRQIQARLVALGISEARALNHLADTEAEHARLQALLSAMNLGILFVAPDGRVVYHNPAFTPIWRLAEGANLIGLTVGEALARSGCALSEPERFLEHMRQLLTRQGESETYEITTRDGRIVNQLSYPVRDTEQQFIGHLWVYEDITSERQTAEQLLYLAERDSLTGLYNRHRFQAEIERMLAESMRHNTPSALLYFDLDEFKTINDHFGHKTGDALLVRVAGEVSGLTRKNEMLFRLGGDEFAVLMPNADVPQAETLAGRIVHAITQIPFRFEGRILHITSSLGIALYPRHAADQDQLVACADTAMYQAKEAGKNTWRLYRADLDTTPEMVNRLSWNERLAQAMQHDRFELHYQGVYATADRRLLHVEALLRLRDEHSDELIPPGQFIPVAEKSHLILEIDRWVLRQVIGLLAERPQAPPIAVNISGRSFDDPGLPNTIIDLLRTHQVDPARLILEITETAAVSDLSDAQRFIDALKQAGCQVCLDDFGAGFASFAYLKHIRVDTIKLDGMFIRNLPHDHDNQVFVRGMVEVSRGLGKQTVAECVEDEATLKLLAELGVDKAQGYHLDRPQARHPALFTD